MTHQWLALLAIAGVAPVAAQPTSDDATRQLVERAIARRQQAFADSTLQSYTATAHGIVTFRAELGVERDRSRRAVKADELAVEVYWQRPDRSKQIIRAWRDSTLFPTDLAYHRDHLGIVTDDFGPRIRIGDGDEVADVVHPLSPDGPSRYNYRLGDTLVIAGPAGRVVLVALEVEPKDLLTPSVIGVLYLDRDRAQVVRSRLTFTPSAYLDRDLEDITVGLERSLVDGRYWLPYRQEIEIRRRASWVDFPIRGVIRGDWTIGEYRINERVPETAWTGPSIGGLLRPTPGGEWSTPLAAVIDSTSMPATGRELAQIRSTAVRLARSQWLDGLPRLRPAVSRISDVLRFNRVQGLVIGAGLSWRAGPVGRLAVAAGYGGSDHRITGRLDLRRAMGDLRWTAFAERTIIDAGAFPATSMVLNSIAAQEWGGDLADYVLVERIGLEASRRTASGPELAASVVWDQSSSVEATAGPARGSLRPNPSLGGAAGWRIAASMASGSVDAQRGRLGYLVTGEVGLGPASYGRIVGTGGVAFLVGPGTLGARGGFGLATGRVPAWRAFAAGGPGTVVGQPFRGFGGRHAAWTTLDWLVAAPSISVPLARLGSTTGRSQVGPLIALGWAGGSVTGAPWSASKRVGASVGVAAELFDRAIRFEVGRRITGGSGLGLSIDFNRAWWPIL